MPLPLPAIRHMGDVIACLAELQPRAVSTNMSILMPYLACRQVEERATFVDIHYISVYTLIRCVIDNCVKPYIRRRRFENDGHATDFPNLSLPILASTRSEPALSTCWVLSWLMYLDTNRQENAAITIHAHLARIMLQSPFMRISANHTLHLSVGLVPILA